MEVLTNDIDTLTQEIREFQKQIGESVFEIGKRLKHIKENDLTHGSYIKWLESVDITPRTAQRMVQAFEQFGNTSAASGLSAGKIYEMLSLPHEVNRDEFIKVEHVVPSIGKKKKVEEMTTKEIREVVKSEQQPYKKQNISKKKAKPIDDKSMLIEFITHLSNSKLIDIQSLSIKNVVLLSKLPVTEQERAFRLLEKYQGSVLEACNVIELVSEGVNDENIKLIANIIRQYNSMVLILSTEKERLVKKLIDSIEHFHDNAELSNVLLDIKTKLEDIKEDNNAQQQQQFKETWEQFYKDFTGQSNSTTTIQKPTPYELLGVDPTASHDEIKKRYRALMKVVHPDCGATNDYLFKLIKEAYDSIEKEVI